jgi:hypothetical protein
LSEIEDVFDLLVRTPPEEFVAELTDEDYWRAWQRLSEAGVVSEE